MSLHEFQTSLLEGVRGRLWAQWSALGARSTAQFKPTTVDLEALLLGTLSFARTEPRLFDEALSWCCQFGEFVHANRLKKLLAEVPDASTTRLAGAWAETVGEQGRVSWNLNIDLPETSDCLENVFFTETLDAQSTRSRRDGIFEKWGFSRGPFDPRDHAMPPDFSDLGLTQLFARKFMGSGCRAEVFSNLLLGANVTTTELAEMTLYSRRLVQAVLGDLKDIGILDWDPGRGRTTRASLSRRSQRDIVSLITRKADSGDPYGHFETRDWPGFYLGFHSLWRALVRIKRSGFDGFKAQSLLRDGLEEATGYHRRTSRKAVYDPRLTAESIEDLLQEAHIYLDSLLVEDVSLPS